MFAAATAVPESAFAVLSRDVDEEISRRCFERVRDSVLRFFAHPGVSFIFFFCFIVVMVGVVGWGLIIAYSVLGLFLGVDNGWNRYMPECIELAVQWNQTLSPTYIPKPPNAQWGWSRTAEVEYCTSNQLYFNMAIKAFVVLFSYINFLPIPWSLSILHHSWVSNRFEYPMVIEESEEVIGFDFYGRRTKSIWFCLPRSKRRLIALLLNCAWIFHFACLAMHFVYRSYLEGQTWPGAFWQNIFFVLSIASQVGASCVQSSAEAGLRKLAPTTYPRSSVTILKDGWRKWRLGESGGDGIEDAVPLEAEAEQEDVVDKGLRAVFARNPKGLLSTIVAEFRKEERLFGKETRPLTGIEVDSIYRPKIGMPLPATASQYLRREAASDETLQSMGMERKGCVEMLRDAVLRFFAHRLVLRVTLTLSILTILCVIGWGLVIAWTILGLFLGVDNGWNRYMPECIELAAQWNQTLSPTYIPKPPNAQWGWSRTAEVEYCTSNQLYFNMAIKAFVVLFSYINFLPIPWSLSILHHSWVSNRFKEPEQRVDPEEGFVKIVGFDFYGVEIVHTPDNKSIWFCLPRSKRRLIALLLNCAWIFHFACLAMHFVYQSYLEGQTWPGAFWQNIFFVLSIASQMLGYHVQERAESHLRQIAGEMGRERRITRILKCSLRNLAGATANAASRLQRSTVRSRSALNVRHLGSKSTAAPRIPQNAQVSFSKSPSGASTGTL